MAAASRTQRLRIEPSMEAQLRSDRNGGPGPGPKCFRTSASSRALAGDGRISPLHRSANEEASSGAVARSDVSIGAERDTSREEADNLARQSKARSNVIVSLLFIRAPASPSEQRTSRANARRTGPRTATGRRTRTQSGVRASWSTYLLSLSRPGRAVREPCTDAA